MPILLIGSIIWLASEIFFDLLFGEFEFNFSFLVVYVSMIVLEVNLFIVFYFVSKKDKTNAGLIIFFAFCYIAGILSLPIIIFTEFLPQVRMFITLTFGAEIIVCIIGIVLREKYFAKGYLWAHIILFLAGIAVVEFIFIIIFNIQNFLLTIPVTLAYISIVSLTIMFYGSKAVQKTEKGSWIYIFFKVEAILLLALIVAIIVVVVVLIFIIIAIAVGDSNIDLSSLTWGSGTRRKKKKSK
ncbi:MAG: hypothetical protein ACFE8M_00080 [Candidatus Hermodarchaeota archaeon]